MDEQLLQQVKRLERENAELRRALTVVEAVAQEAVRIGSPRDMPPSPPPACHQ